MKALLLTAGLGTRLQPFTFFQAKASLPLLDVPFVHFPLQYLYSNQITDVVLNLHTHPDSVRNAAGKQYRGMNISYSFEPEILGTAGAIRKATENFEDGPFVVMNGDMILDVPLSSLLEQHQETDADVTLVITRGDRYARYGGIYFTEAERPAPRLAGFQEGQGEKYHYCGLQMIHPRVIERIPENTKTEIFHDIYPEMIREGKIFGYVYEGFWMEMGNLRDYLETAIQLARQPLPARLQPEEIAKSLVSLSATIEPGAVIKETIVMEGSTIAEAARLERCIVGPGLNVTSEFRNVALARGVLPWRITA